MNLGSVELWSGAGDDAERHLRQGLELAGRNGRPYVEMGCLGHLALAVGRHSLAAMRETALQTLRIMERHGWLAEPIAPMVLATMGAADILQGRFDAADPWLDRAEGALPANAEPAKEILVRHARGLQRLGQGRLAEARVSFAETQRLQTLLVSPDPLAIWARGCLAQVLTRMGDLPRARATLDTASDGEREYADTRAASAAIHLAERDPRAAIADLAPVLSATPQAGATHVVRDVSVINALILDALARATLGDARDAEDDIERALDLAERDALILPFLVTPARDLLQQHPGHRTAHAALLASILDVLSSSSLPARRSEPADFQEELTESEMRVLGYLPSNLSAPEIAAEIFLSTSTVKTHMRHIYEKLGVHRRTEAVECARGLGLLGPSARGRRQG
jgi:LuxR family maltose regulon positive regulatory protein